MHRTSKAAFAAALCSLALPAGAGAATKTVTAGPPIEKPPAGVPKDAFVNQFFPRSVAVHEGDSLTFKIAGFHAVNFLVDGESVPGLAVPAPGVTHSGVKDAAGQDFWFNGQPQLILNPTLVAGTPSGGAYDGTQAVYSGAPLAEGPPKPWSVKLTKAGKYSFYCLIHPGMRGQVKVVAKGKGGVPNAKADAAHVRNQLRKTFKNLKKLDKRKAPKGDVVVAGPDLPSGEALARFTPANKKIKAGTALTLTMSPGTTETHSFTFAAKEQTLEDLAKVFIAPLPSATPGPPQLGLDGRAVYPSDAPPAPYDGTNHGDGFLNTGVLDGDPASPLPLKATVTFSKAGTYKYICIIHPEMKGQVTVK